MRTISSAHWIFDLFICIFDLYCSFVAELVSPALTGSLDICIFIIFLCIYCISVPRGTKTSTKIQNQSKDTTPLYSKFTIAKIYVKSAICSKVKNRRQNTPKTPIKSTV